MKTATRQDIEIRHEDDDHRFVTRIDGKLGYLDYEVVDDDTLDYKSTFVPSAHREQGIGSSLVEHALDYARDNGYRVVPSCPFVKSFIDEHSEYEDLVAG